MNKLKRWQRIRLEIIERDKICQECFTENAKEVHHKDGSGDQSHNYRANNKPENLILYCKSCHIKIHWREGRTYQQFG